MKRAQVVVPLILVVILTVMGTSGLASEGSQLPTPDSVGAVSDSLVADSIVLEPVLYKAGSDTTLINALLPEESVTVRANSPTRALFKSVVFPGWGQYSNRKYIKAGLVFAVESYFIYKAVDNAREASDWRRKWKTETEADLRAKHFRKYTSYRDNRNSNLWITAAVTFMSMFDAYVDAHLSSFPPQIDKAKKLSFEIAPEQAVGFRLAYRF